MLNDTAIDLGATSFDKYGTEKFGCAELNKITQALVSSGVLRSGGALRPVVETDSSGEYIVIQDGTAVFNDGAKFTQSSRISYASVSSLKGEKVYILNDTTNGMAILKHSAEYPTSSDYVKIAEISSNGTLTDTRTICAAKVELTSGNNLIQKDLTVNYSGSSTTASATFTAEEWKQKNYLMVIAWTPDQDPNTDGPRYCIAHPVRLPVTVGPYYWYTTPYSISTDSNGDTTVTISETDRPVTLHISQGIAILA